MVYPVGSFSSGSVSATDGNERHSVDKNKDGQSSASTLPESPGDANPHTAISPSARKFQTELQAPFVNPKSQEASDDKKFEELVSNKFGPEDAAEIKRDYRRLDATENTSQRQELKRRLRFFVSQGPKEQEGIFALSSWRATVQSEEKITFQDDDIRDMMKSFGLEGGGTADGILKLDQIFAEFYDAINLSYTGVHPHAEAYESEKYETLPQDQWENRLYTEGDPPEIREALKDLREASESISFVLHVSKNNGDAQGTDVLLNIFGAEPANAGHQEQLDAIFENKDGPLHAPLQKLNSALERLFNDSLQADAPRRLKGICGFSLGALAGVGAKIGSDQLKHVPLLLLDPVPQNTPLATMFAGAEGLQKFSKPHGVAIVLNNPRDQALSLYQFMEKLGYKYPGLFVINAMLKPDDSKGYANGKAVAGEPQPNLIFGYHGRKENMQMYANTILRIREGLQRKSAQLTAQ
jgi:hypothetical protein